MFATTFPWFIYAVATAFEFLFLLFRLPRAYRVFASSTLIVLLAAAHGAIVFSVPVIFSVPFLFIGVYRLLNLMRFAYGRMHDDYLFRAVSRTSRVLFLAQITAGAAAMWAAHNSLHIKVGLSVLALVQLTCATVLLASLWINLQKSRYQESLLLTDKALPSLSVLIPARNETEDLEACLKTLVASTYQKLEILVLDDCSQDRTPDIIKQFAHDGVRFVRGTEPGETWLPKNAAYDKLAHEASGEYLLFCGVDVRFEPDALKKMVSYLKNERLSMLSMLPNRPVGAKSSSIAQQIRYLWELGPPRFMVHRPAVLSTLWLIEATALKKHGGLAAVRRTVVPEGFFARELDKTDTYRFLRTGPHLAITSDKPARDQRETTIRVRYPQLHRRPEVVMMVALFEILAVLGSFASSVYGAYKGYPAVTAVSGVAAILYLTSLALLAFSITEKRGVIFMLQALGAPFVDLWLMHRSMYIYEFDEMRWKQRNVCLQVMHATPSLPRLPDIKSF